MSWGKVALGSVCKTSAGGTPLKSEKEYYENGNVPWLLSGEVCSKEIFSSANYITEKGVKNSSAKVFPKNTVLVAMYGATAGQVGILRFPAATNQAVCGILPNEKYLPEFLYYFLSFYKETLLLEVSGVAQPNLSQLKIKSIPLPIVSLNIQLKIVEKLDAIFAEIEKAAAAAEANLKNAETLFKNYLTQQLNYKNGIREPLDFFCSRITDGSHFSPKTTDDGYPYITVRDVGNFGIDFENCKYVSADDYEILKNNGCKPSYLDLLFSKDGTVGKVAIVNREIDFVVLSSLAIITPKTNIINPEYLFYILKSPNFIAEAIGKKTGVAIRRIILKNLKSIFIEVPPLSDQMNTVQKIRSVEERCEVINNYYEKKINELILFKKSILNKAFSGELVKE